MIVVQLEVELWLVVKPPESVGRIIAHVGVRIRFVFAFDIFPVDDSLVVGYATLGDKQPARMPTAPTECFVCGVKDAAVCIPVVK